MVIKIKAFGIAREILGDELTLDISSDSTNVKELKDELNAMFPALLNLKQYFIAVNEAYADDNQTFVSSDEIVIIPPVSGG